MNLYIYRERERETQKIFFKNSCISIQFVDGFTISNINSNYILKAFLLSLSLSLSLSLFSTNLQVEKWNLLIQCIAQPMDSDDQISGHNCCRWNNEKYEAGDRAYKCHSTSLLLSDHSQSYLLSGVVSSEVFSH